MHPLLRCQPGNIRKISFVDRNFERAGFRRISTPRKLGPPIPRTQVYARTLVQNSEAFLKPVGSPYQRLQPSRPEPSTNFVWSNINHFHRLPAVKSLSDVHEYHSPPTPPPDSREVFARSAPGRAKRGYGLEHGLHQENTSEAESQTVMSAANTPPTPKKILIVQGDWEAGMSRLALDLKDAGHEVSKIVFCAPDLIYKTRGITTHTYRKQITVFGPWLRELVADHGYDTIFLYNHYRPYNQIAWDMADELGLDCWVFELGLIRPNCVMVFQSSQFPVKAIAEQWTALLAGGDEPPEHVTPRELCRVNTPTKMFIFGANFVFSRVTSPFFPNFIDQREMGLWHHLKHGLIYVWRFLQRASDEDYDLLMAGELSKKYYAVPLQVHSDTQILCCSDFESIEHFIHHVVDSFEKNAPADTKLIFKVHPMDRGYKDYDDLIRGLDEKLGGGRIFYVDRVHLPTMLDNAIGVVNINSSVGISGLIHHVPVITLGKAVYNLPKLTYQGNLDSFWTAADPPVPLRVKQFLRLLLASNQGRGTLSQRCFNVPGRCRIKWPQPFHSQFFSDSKLP